MVHVFYFLTISHLGSKCNQTRPLRLLGVVEWSCMIIKNANWTFVFVEVLLFLFPAILRRQSFYFIRIILLGLGSFIVSCNQFDIPPPSLAFFLSNYD